MMNRKSMQLRFIVLSGASRCIEGVVEVFKQRTMRCRLIPRSCHSSPTSRMRAGRSSRIHVALLLLLVLTFDHTRLLQASTATHAKTPHLSSRPFVTKKQGERHVRTETDFPYHRSGRRTASQTSKFPKFRKQLEHGSDR
ncbi:unnamed protein product [Cercospora beticola]|nr:unnamed protein product [Cercospora beticola]